MAKNRANPPILNADGASAAKRKPVKPVSPSAPGKIRIVGGLWKRTPMQVVDAPGLRPTPDRVRENLFNWLGPSVRGARCLDLFAGTGALGLEAVSRGAAFVHFNEPQAQAASAIEALLTRLQRPPGAEWQISRLDAAQLLSRWAGPDKAQGEAGAISGATSGAGFDLVFLDPPFHKGWLARILPGLGRLLRPGARVYIESEEPVQHPALSLLKSGQAGVVHYHLFQFVPASDQPHSSLPPSPPPALT